MLGTQTPARRRLVLVQIEHAGGVARPRRSVQIRSRERRQVQPQRVDDVERDVGEQGGRVAHGLGVAKRQSAGRGYAARAASRATGSRRPWVRRKRESPRPSSGQMTARRVRRATNGELARLSAGAATGTTRRKTSWSAASASRKRPARMAQAVAGGGRSTGEGRGGGA